MTNISLLYMKKIKTITCVREDQMMFFLPSLNLQVHPMALCVCQCVSEFQKKRNWSQDGLREWMHAAMKKDLTQK